jgi:hypothetical protein
VTTIINFSDSHNGHLLVQAKADGVLITDGTPAGVGGEAIFIPDVAVLPLIRALREFEQEQQTKLSNSWGV